MAGKWLVLLPLVVDLYTVMSVPVSRAPAHTGSAEAGAGGGDCPCCPGDDAEPSASILLPALRAMQPYLAEMRPDQKPDPKPLLQPEVGLASSVLETLREATNEEYQEALARDAARSAVKLLKSTLDASDDTLMETPKSKVRIFVNTNDDMDDNLPEPSHIQETRCIHSPLESIHKNRQLRISRPTPIIEVIDLFPKSMRKLKNKSILHRNLVDMDSGIGASNIQERVMQPDLESKEANAALLPLFTQNNLGKMVDHKDLQKNLSNEHNLTQKVKPNIHLKLRELIDNLEDISKKEKSKLSTHDLKKYIPTTVTRNPPLKSKPIENLVYNRRPFSLKDVMKLKDVELISQKSRTRNTGMTKSSYPNLKLQSESFRDTNKCREDSNNLESIMEKDSLTTVKQNLLDNTDVETSPTNSIPVFESKSKHFKQTFIPTECLENSGPVSSTASDTEGHDNFDYSEIDLEEDFNKEKLFSDNCNGPPESFFIQKSPSNQDNQQGLRNNGFSKVEVQKLLDSDDITNNNLNNEVFPVELLEDFDTTIKVDDSSFIRKSHLKNKGNLDFTNYENIIGDPVADSSINSLQIGKQSNECPSTSNVNLKEILDNCDTQESFTKKTNFISEYPNSMEKNRNIMQLVSSEGNENGDINSANDIFCDETEGTSQLSFNDLQNMSNNILNLSECEPPKERMKNTESNFNEVLDQVNDDYDITLSEPVSETHIQDIKSSLNANNEVNEASSMNYNDNLKVSSDVNEFCREKTMNSNMVSSEMRTEASEIDFKSDDTQSKNEIVIVDKPSIFLNNLKSKLGSLFRITEKVNTSDILNSMDDNTYESSNIKPMVAKFDEFKNLKMQRTPHTLFKDISPLNLPGISQNSFKNKLAAPNYIDQLINSNSPKLFSSPSELSRQFQDTLDPSLAFTALSDKLRSHTEHTIQNVKKTLESTLKDSQTFRIDRPTNTINTKDILDSIANRRDEMREGLEAIHLDLNDRFSSFQQSILDQFNPPGEYSKLREHTGNGAVRASSSIRKNARLLEGTKLQNVQDDRNFLPHRLSGTKKGKNTEISFTSPIDSDKVHQGHSHNNPSLLNPTSLSATTTIPYFIPRPKVLKTNIDSTPRITGEKLSKIGVSKIPSTLDEKVTKIKPSFNQFLLKSAGTSNFSEEPNSSTNSLSRANIPSKPSKVKPSKITIEKMNRNNPSIDFPVLSRPLNQKNLKPKSKSEFVRSQQDIETKSNSLGDNGDSRTKQESLLRRMKELRPRLGSSRNNEELMLSSTSNVHPSQKESELRLVEPLQENVPYKCKLICYKES